MIREKRFYFFSGGWKTIFWLIGGKTYKATVASINLLWNDKAALKASGYLGSSAVKPSGSEIMNQASKISRFKNYYKSELFWLSYGFCVCAWFPASLLYLGFSLYSETSEPVFSVFGTIYKRGGCFKTGPPHFEVCEVLYSGFPSPTPGLRISFYTNKRTLGFQVNHLNPEAGDFWINSKLLWKSPWNQESGQAIVHTMQCLGQSQTCLKAPGQSLF